MPHFAKNFFKQCKDLTSVNNHAAALKKIKKLKSATEPATPDIIQPLPKNEG